MLFFIGDSHLKRIEHKLHSRFPNASIKSISGAKIEDVNRNLSSMDLSQYSAVYVLVGGNNLTTKTPSGTHLAYGTQQEMVNEIELGLKDLNRIILEKKSIPVFSTVFSIDIATYNARNNIFISNPEMQQEILCHATINSNRMICSLNKHNGVSTPQLVREVMRYNSKKQILEFKGARMIDGCHLKEQTYDTMFEILKRTILNNIANNNHGQ